MRRIGDPAPHLEEIVQASCWSMWEGCVCRHLKDHFGLHGCADRKCSSTWTTEQAREWGAAERAAHGIGQKVNDRHRSEDTPEEKLDS